MRKFLLAAAVAGLALVGCQGGDKSNQQATLEDSVKERTDLAIAVIPKGTTHEFWKAVQSGAEQAGRDLGVRVIWKGPIKEDDREEQIKVVEDFISQKVAGIVLAPLDDAALVGPVEAAIAEDIPVVIFDSGLKSDKMKSFVATDNKAAGAKAGQAMAERLGGKGDVIVLRYQEGSASTREREEGFIEAAKAGGLNVISQEQFAGPTTESAQKAAENLISRFKDGAGLKAQGIFCPNESSTFGMLRALQDASLAGKVRFIGFDSSAKLIEGLNAGQIDALVVQDPVSMGRLAVETIVKSIRGESIESRIDTGSHLVTKDNFATPEIQAVIGGSGK